MINSTIKKLQAKITSIENKLESLEKSTVTQFDNSIFSIYTNNLLNYKVISQRKFLINTLKDKQKNKLFLQLNIKFTNQSNQKIEFNLYCNNMRIGSIQQQFNSDNCETTISGTYQNILSEDLKIQISVSPKNNKPVTILSTTLLIWGISQEYNKEYSAVETDNLFALSYLSNNRLYYKFFEKDTSPSTTDFSFFGESTTHSLCNYNNQIVLFYTDIHSNLFCRNLSNNNEIFITNNVSNVSCCSFKNSIYFAYISDNNCYYGEIFNNSVISNKKITTLFGSFKSCYLHSNNEKCYMILTKENNANYLLETISTTFNSHENINANVSLEISATTEGLWNSLSTID